MDDVKKSPYGEYRSGTRGLDQGGKENHQADASVPEGRRLLVLRGIGATDRRWHLDEVEWGAICGLKPVPILYDFHAYHSLDARGKQRVKAKLPWVVLGTAAKGSTRSATAMLSYSGIALDIEQQSGSPPPPVASAVEMLEALDISGFVYTSTSHTEEKPRYRIMVPTAKQIPAERYQGAAKKLAENMGISEWTAPESYELARVMYLPAKLRGGHYDAHQVVGKSWYVPSGGPVGHSSTAPDAFRNIPTTWTDSELIKAKRALKTLDPDVSYPEWIRMGQALHSAGAEDGWTLWREWSKRGEKYTGTDDLRKHWRTFKPGAGVTLATVYAAADKADRGWRNAPSPNPTAKAERKHHAAPVGYTLGDIKSVEFAQAAVMLPGIMAEGLMLLVGQKKVAHKTWFMLQAAAQLSAGNEMLRAKPPGPMPVAVFALEEGGTVLDKHGNEAPALDVVCNRLKAMMLYDIAAKHNVRFFLELPPLQSGGLESIESAAREHKVIFIDSRAMIFNEAADTEKNIWLRDYKQLQPIKDIARRNHICIVVITHTSKDSDMREAIDSGNATGGTDAAVDGLMVLQKPDKDDRDRFRMTVHHRQLPSSELELRWDPNSKLWVSLGGWVPFSGRTHDVFDAVLSGVPSAGLPPVSTDQIIQTVWGSVSDSSRAACSRALSALVRAELVQCAPDRSRGNNAAAWAPTQLARDRASIIERTTRRDVPLSGASAEADDDWL